jgi:hypothetical protein
MLTSTLISGERSANDYFLDRTGCYWLRLWLREQALTIFHKVPAYLITLGSVSELDL